MIIIMMRELLCVPLAIIHGFFNFKFLFFKLKKVKNVMDPILMIVLNAKVLTIGFQKIMDIVIVKIIIIMLQMYMIALSVIIHGFLLINN